MIDHGVLLESQQFLQEQVGTRWPWEVVKEGRGRNRRLQKCVCVYVPVFKIF